MAFDEPSPFDGDPVFNYLDRVSNQPPLCFKTKWPRRFKKSSRVAQLATCPPSSLRCSAAIRPRFGLVSCGLHRR